MIEATNCHRAIVASQVSLAGDLGFSVIDFKDMPMGIVHVFWSGLNALDGLFTLYASSVPDLSSFDSVGTRIDGAEIKPHASSGSRIWIRDRLAFRYLLVRWEHGTNTTGLGTVIALGKKS